MKIKFVLFLVIFTISSVAISAQIPIDKQIWTSADFIIGLKKGKDMKGRQIDKISLILQGIERFGNDVSRAVDQRIGVSIDVRVNKFSNITTGYVHQKSSPFRNVQQEESRFVLAGTFNKRITNFNFRAREQLDYRFRNNRADTQNYRTLLQLNYFLKYRGKDLFSPFASEEFYYDAPAKNIARNEIRAGITRNFTKKVSTDFFYIRLYTRTVSANCFGVGFRFKLR